MKVTGVPAQMVVAEASTVTEGGPTDSGTVTVIVLDVTDGGLAQVASLVIVH